MPTDPKGWTGWQAALRGRRTGGDPCAGDGFSLRLGAACRGLGSAFSPLRLPAPARLLLRACSPRRVFPFLPCLWRRPRLGVFLAMSRATDPPVAAWPAGPAAGSVRPPAPASQLRQLRHQSGCRHDLSSPVVAACKQRSCTGDVRRGRRGLWAAPPLNATTTGCGAELTSPTRAAWRPRGVGRPGRL